MNQIHNNSSGYHLKGEAVLKISPPKEILFDVHVVRWICSVFVVRWICSFFFYLIDYATAGADLLPI